ncbi:MAG: hypothetical protein ITG02_12875 [Patulibacter sp.]|nr:hypothetical protein [Patulibacter sp.]
MRRAGLIFLVTVLLGAVAFVALGALRQSDDAFTLNVPITGVAAELPPEATFCQSQIDVPIGGAFDGGRLTVGTDRRRGPRLQVLIADDQGVPISRATIPAGYADNSVVRFRFDRTVASGTGLQLCVTNDGDGSVFPYGSGGDPNPSTTFTLDGQGSPVDVSLVFERPSRSTLAAAGDMLERATLFRTPRLSAALYGTLLLLLFAGATVAGTLALRAAEREDDAADVDRD